MEDIALVGITASATIACFKNKAYTMGVFSALGLAITLLKTFTNINR